jgi:hypothetical protein
MNEERGAALTVKNLELRYLTSCRTGPVPNVLEFFDDPTASFDKDTGY